MRTVLVKLEGNAKIISFGRLEDDDFYEESTITYFLDNIKVWRGNEEMDESGLPRLSDITGDKGKYIRSKTVSKEIVKDCSDAIELGYGHCEVYFKVRLDEYEDFNPKYLQLIKSDYEFKFLPYGIMGTVIEYRGEKVYAEFMNKDIEYEYELYNIDYELPYVK